MAAWSPLARGCVTDYQSVDRPLASSFRNVECLLISFLLLLPAGHVRACMLQQLDSCQNLGFSQVLSLRVLLLSGRF